MCLWEVWCIWYDIIFGLIVFVFVYWFNFLNDVLNVYLWENVNLFVN